MIFKMPLSSYQRFPISFLTTILGKESPVSVNGLSSHLDHKMKETGLYSNYTMLQLLDKLDVLECFEDANHSLRIGEMLNKQAEIYEALGVDVPTSSC